MSLHDSALNRSRHVCPIQHMPTLTVSPEVLERRAMTPAVRFTRGRKGEDAPELTRKRPERTI